MLADAIPQELKEQARWITWQHVPRSEGSKPAKLPRNARTGQPANVTNPSDWSTYAEAVASNATRGHNGVGFVLGDGFVGIDLDNCLTTETNVVVTSDYAKKILADFPTYAEVSPSGKGIKLICRGAVPSSRVRHADSGDTEIYNGARYFAITGNVVDAAHAAVIEANGQLTALWESLAAKKATGEIPDATLKLYDTNPKFADLWLRKFPEGRRSEPMQAIANAMAVAGMTDDDLLASLVFWGKRQGYQEAEIERKAAYAISKAAERATEVRAEITDFSTLMTGAELVKRDIRPHFLCDRILVEGQPMIVGGRSKTLKTTVIADLVVSLGTGTPFLGRFRTDRVPVAFWSGESGLGTIRETAMRIARAKGVRLEESDTYWCCDLPRLSSEVHLAAIGDVIAGRKIKVAVFDPLYLALLNADTAGSASNLFAMGSVLQPITRLGQKLGCTIMLLHHNRKSGDGNGGLDELSQSGASEWARQWILLRRTQPYQGGGKHTLEMQSGGSAGHFAHLILHIDEGEFDAGVMTGRKWDLKVQTAGEMAISMENEKREAVLSALKQLPAGESERVIAGMAHMGGNETVVILKRLEIDGYIERAVVAGKFVYRLKTANNTTDAK
jgi:hypothetical protein